jgi:hypothetical protein
MDYNLHDEETALRTCHDKRQRLLLAHFWGRTTLKVPCNSFMSFLLLLKKVKVTRENLYRENLKNQLTRVRRVCGR